MSTVDDLRDALVSLERLAPDHLPDVIAGQDRVGTAGDRGTRRRVIGTVASAAVVAAVAITVVTLSGHHAHRSPAPPAGPSTPGPLAALGCPSAVATSASTWVPDQAHGFDPATRLAPPSTPTRITICAYPGKNSPVSGGAIRLADGLAAAGGYLSEIAPAEPTGCLLYLAPTDSDKYLVLLTYRHASVWVNVSGDHCGGVSNGRFSSATFLGSLVSSWYATGRGTVPDATCTANAPGGRLGQQSRMVADQPIAVAICGRSGQTGSRTITGQSLAKLVAALNQPATHPLTTGGRCTPTGTPGAVQAYQLVFRYAQGPLERVLAISSCTPEIQNGNLGIASAPSLVAMIDELFRTGAVK